ncbi:MAG TPA: amidohydrolase family protein [Acidimicrobiales bacterium]|nr:amidohydrolase family protein [Acidimicrobiales bacterium]
MKIDAFSHVIPESYLDRLDAAVASGTLSARVDGFAPWIREDPALTDLGARFRAMDPFPDYRQVLTLAVPPIDEVAGGKAGAALAAMANDGMAELVRAHPDRFFGFAAALPMGDPEAAAAELQRAMHELDAFGAQVHTNVAGRPLDDPAFAPVLDAADESAAVVWIHPTRSPIWADYPVEHRSKYGIWWSLGWPYETSVCMARLVYSGLVGRLRRVRFIAHHAGAMVPHFSGRLASPIEDETRESILASLTDAPIALFRRFYTDTAMFGAGHAVRCAVEFFGPDHVLYGTDMPLGGPKVIADTIADVEHTGLDQTEVRKIFELNARRLFARPAQPDAM